MLNQQEPEFDMANDQSLAQESQLKEKTKTPHHFSSGGDCFAFKPP